MKTQDVTYRTEVTTTVVQEPRVADVPPVVVSEYEIQRAQLRKTFVTERVRYEMIVYMSKQHQQMPINLY